MSRDMRRPQGPTTRGCAHWLNEGVWGTASSNASGGEKSTPTQPQQQSTQQLPHPCILSPPSDPGEQCKTRTPLAHPARSPRIPSGLSSGTERTQTRKVVAKENTERNDAAAQMQAVERGQQQRQKLTRQGEAATQVHPGHQLRKK